MPPNSPMHVDMKLNTVDATRPYGPPNIAIAATISRLPVTISTQDPLSIPSMTFDKPSAAPSNESTWEGKAKEKENSYKGKTSHNSLQ